MPEIISRFMRRDRRGGVLAVIGISLPVLLGVTALSVDVGVWYNARRGYQTASDSAAIGGAWARIKKGAAAVNSTALADAARNGFTPTGSATITVNNPPTSGPNAGQDDAVEVIITVPESTMLSSMVFSGSISNKVRSVAIVEVTGTACVLALNGTAQSALKVYGNTSVEAVGCVLASNSDASNSIDIGGSSSLSAQSLWSAGGAQIAGTTTLADTPITNAWALPDPYESLQVTGMPGTCTVSNPPNYNSSLTLSPGRYCGDIQFGAQAVIDLTPGVYYLDQGDLTVNAGAKVRCSTCDSAAGTGITFVLTSSGDPANIGTVTINGGADVQLSAPTTGYYKGVLYYQDQRAPTGLAKFNGGANQILNGAIYFKNQQIQYNGDHDASATSCTQIIGDTVEFTGNSTVVNNGCAQAGITPITVQGARLVE
jgi:putative Flp pilus-assembly TadE/G-like protein